MKAFVIVATKGRAKETYILLDYLAKQTLAASFIYLVGSEQKDVEGLEQHPLFAAGKTAVLLSPAGLTIQRNAGLITLTPLVKELPPQDWFVTFFDDDFRPAPNWLENAAKALQQDSTVVGITGNVLADGVNTEFGIAELDAPQYINGTKPPETHWSSAAQKKHLDGLYGCNMCYRGTVASGERFDEHLPMYGWQEDWDYSSRARKFGSLILEPSCRGVHLGVSSGRTSGVRFGYSQISNPIFLLKKGSMSWSKAALLMSKNIASNMLKTLLMVRDKDFPGRLRGNLLAFLHLLTGKLDPLHVLKI